MCSLRVLLRRAVGACAFLLVLALVPVAFAGHGRLHRRTWHEIELTAKLIAAGDANALAQRVQYPLTRENPLPDITNAAEFVERFPVLFGPAFRAKVAKLRRTDLFRHDGDWGAFNGDLWFDANGRILSVNRLSHQERTWKARKTIETYARMYPGIPPAVANLYYCKGGHTTFRVDKMRDGFRYIAWGKGKVISDKPDLILTNGTQEAQGSSGGVTYTFTNGDWKYVVDDWYTAESAKDIGVHLIVRRGDTTVESTKCRRMK